MNFLNKIKRLRESYLIAFLIILIAVMINFIASNRFLRLDLTKNQLYAISTSSQDIMSNLEDIVTVKVFFSDQLPPNLLAIEQYVRDILDELSSYANGNLNIEYMNPSLPEIQNEALSLGIPQIQMNIIEKDKLEVKNGFLGISIQYGEKNEILPVVQSIVNVEYDLVASIKKVTSAEEKTIGFLSGYGEPKLDERISINGEADTLGLLKQGLDRNYVVKNINLSQGDSLKQIDTLLIIGPKAPLNESEKTSINNFVREGGNLIAMLDQYDISGDLQITANKFEIDKLLAGYGIKLSKTFALDRSNERASFNQGFMNFVVSYPFWVKSINENFHSSNPMVANMESVVFPWVSPINLNQQQGVKVQSIIKTTESAWSQEEPFNLEPNLIQTPQSKSQYDLSLLSEKPADKTAGKVLVIANSRFITDRFIKMFPQNLPFAMNAVDYLTLDSTLINIRSKSTFSLPLKELNINERNIVKFVGILLMPILVMLYGIIHYFNRRKKLASIHWEK